MADQIKVMGMVISSAPIGEHDKRIVLLTKEKGKISAFARGARRPGNHLMAASESFAFGSFYLIYGGLIHIGECGNFQLFQGPGRGYYNDIYGMLFP